MTNDDDKCRNESAGDAKMVLSRLDDCALGRSGRAMPSSARFVHTGVAPPGSVCIAAGLGMAYVTIAGVVIGLMHERPVQISVALGVVLSLVFWGVSRNPRSSHFSLFVLGVLLTLLTGWGVESWGTRNGYWVYHDLAPDQRLPSWVPLAWALAYVVLYKTELRIVDLLRLESMGARFLLVGFVCGVLPVWGEMVAINLGVWTYYWPLTILGVPVLAIVLLMLLHCTIFWVLCGIARRLDWPDGLYNPREPRLGL